jgi:sialic acid synthase SpsE
MPEERELHAFARRTIFTTRVIRANEELTPDNVAVLRCGKHDAGLAPSEYPRLLGQLARHDIPAEHVIRLSDLA